MGNAFLRGQSGSKKKLTQDEIQALYGNGYASILFGATVGDNTLHLREQTGGFDCTVDWGDGLTTVVPVNGGNVIHSYATAGDYNIQIKGKSFAGFYVNTQTGKEKYKALYSMGAWKVDTLTNMSSAFYGCTSLTTLSVDLFRYNTAVTNMSYTFQDCTGLTTLPVDLLKYNTLVTNMSSAFYGCSKLTLRSDIFGEDYANRFNGKTVNFSKCFERTLFTGIQGTAPALWSFTGLTSTKTTCFGGVGNSATSLSNYADIPTEWK